MFQRSRRALCALSLGSACLVAACQPELATDREAIDPAGKGDVGELTPAESFTTPLEQQAWVTRTLAAAFAANPTALPRTRTRVSVQLVPVGGTVYDAVVTNLGDEALVFAKHKSAYVAYARKTGDGARSWYSRPATDPCPGAQAAVCATSFVTVPPAYGEPTANNQFRVEGLDLSAFYIEGLQGTAAPAGWTAIPVDGHYSGFSLSDDRYRLVFQFATLCPPRSYDASPYMGSLDPSLTFCGIGNAFSRTYAYDATP